MSCYWPPRNINLAAQNKTNWRSAQPSQKNKKKSQIKMGVRRWFSRLFFSRKNTKTTRKISKSECRSNFKGALLFRLCSLSLESDNTLACSPSSSSKHSTQHSTHTHKKYKCQKKNTGRSHKSSLLFLFFSFQKNRKKGDREGETGETERQRERERQEREDWTAAQSRHD